MVGNPDISKQERDAALDDVVNELSKIAKELGYKTLLGQTSLPVVIQRAFKLGFKVHPERYTMVTRSL